MTTPATPPPSVAARISWPLVALAAIVVPSVCALAYGLVKSGESLATIVAGVLAILAAVGWQATRQTQANTQASTEMASARTEIATVKELANGNLSRERDERAKVQREAIDQLRELHEKNTADMRAQYQQMLALAVQLPPGTALPQLTQGATLTQDQPDS